MLQTYSTRLSLTWKSKFSVALVVLTSFLLSVALFFPGLDDSDTDWIIGEAISGKYTNWHSAVLEFLLHCAFQVTPYIQAYDILFLAIMTQYWLSLGIASLFVAERSWQRCLFIIMAGFFPPAFIMMLGVQKDSLMSASLLLGYSFLLTADHCQLRQTRTLSVAMLLLFISISERHNAFIAAFPMLVWLASILVRSSTLRFLRNRQPLKSLLLAIIITLFCLSSESIIETNLLKARNTYPLQMLLTWDLVNVSVRSGEMCLPDLYRTKTVALNLDYLKALNLEYANDTIWWWHVPVPHLKTIETEQDMKAVEDCWIQMVVRHPFEYLAHRATATLSLLDVIYKDESEALIPYFYVIYNRADDIANHKPGSEESVYLNSPMRQAIRKYIATPLLPRELKTFTVPWPYILILAILLICNLKFRVWSVIRFGTSEYCIVASALFYTGAFFLLCTNNGQRYMTYPICVFGIIASSSMVKLLGKLLPAKSTKALSDSYKLPIDEHCDS